MAERVEQETDYSNNNSIALVFSLIYRVVRITHVRHSVTLLCYSYFIFTSVVKIQTVIITLLLGLLLFALLFYLPSAI